MTTTSPGYGTTDRTSAPGRTVSIVGICLGLASFLFGILTGIPGLICGIVGVSKGNRLGWWAIGLSVGITVLMVVVAVATGGYHFSYRN
jgi:hypothetical protein